MKQFLVSSNEYTKQEGINDLWHILALSVRGGHPPLCPFVPRSNVSSVLCSREEQEWALESGMRGTMEQEMERYWRWAVGWDSRRGHYEGH